MNQFHNNVYARLHGLSVKYKNRKKGKRFDNWWWLRPDPTDATRVQLGFWGKVGYYEQPGGSYIYLPEEDQPFVPMVIVGPDYLEIYPTNSYGWMSWVPDELIAKYPKIKRMPRTDPYVDIGLNNRLAKLTNPRLRHEGTHDDFPGFNWGTSLGRWYYLGEDKVKLRGPVRYFPHTGKIEALEPQPERIVDKAARRQISTDLRQVFKRLRMLSKLEVHFTLEDFQCFNYSEELLDPHVFMDKLRSADFSVRDQVLELCVRAGMIIIREKNKHWTPDSHRAYRALDEGGLVSSESTLAYLRKVLHRNTKVDYYQI